MKLLHTSPTEYGEISSQAPVSVPVHECELHEAEPYDIIDKAWAKSQTGAVCIPEGVTEIPEELFYYHKTITSVRIPSAV